MTNKSLILKLNSEDILRLFKILLDEEKDKALLFLKECLKPQLDKRPGINEILSPGLGRISQNFK